MTSPIQPDDEEWYAALTLEERADLFEPHAVEALSTSATALRDWRVRKWASQRPFEEKALLERRLAVVRVKLTDFPAVVGLTNSKLRAISVSPPSWLLTLRDYFTHFAAFRSTSHTDAVESSDVPLLGAFLYAAEVHLVRLLREIASSSSRIEIDEPQFLKASQSELQNQLGATIGRVLTLELNVARLREQLAGETAQDRFQSFLNYLRTDVALAAIFKEYSCAARLLVVLTQQHIEATAELIQRFSDDYLELTRQLRGNIAFGVLHHVTRAGVGDSHRCGRSVAILHFSDGLRIVYKPRSLTVDEAFYTLLAWASAYGAFPSVRAIRSLNRTSHGWSEFIQAEPCDSDEAVGRYYHRLGGMLALLYVLDGSDMHWENVIASGEHPVLIDLESLFHPFGDITGAAFAHSLDGPSRSQRLEPLEHMQRSVAKVGLLPVRLWTDREGISLDVSGMGGVSDQLAPGFAVAWENEGTDEMRVKRVRTALGGSLNQPTLASARIDLLRYAVAFEDGFLAMYDCLLARRGELTPECALHIFAAAEVRVVVRATKMYGLLLRESFHPDLMRNALDRDRFFDNLWLAAENNPQLQSLIPFEQDALRRGDVPVFVTTPGGRELVSDTGQVLPNFFQGTGFQRVSSGVATLSEDDRARQRWIVRGMLATLGSESHRPPDTPSEDGGISPLASPTSNRRWSISTEACSDTFIQLAVEIGDRIQALAIRGSRHSSWLTLSADGAFHSVAWVDRCDLHGGTSGILIFLSSLASAAETTKYDDLIRHAFPTVQTYLEECRSNPALLPGSAGLGGVIYAFARLLNPRFGLPIEAAANEALDLIDGVIERHERCDLFSGLAGALGGLLAYATATGSARATASAVRCGNRILHVFEHNDTKVSQPGSFRREAKGGYARGAAGISLALAQLFRFTENGDYLDLATALIVSAIREERSENADATSIRLLPNGPYHHAPGFALAALAVQDCHGSVHDELEWAISLTARRGHVHTSHALCNGTLGNLDILLQARARLHRKYDVEFELIKQSLLFDAHQHGWQCGVPLGLETPGLMNGLAGIGYGLLRLAAPKRVPSVLAFET